MKIICALLLIFNTILSYSQIDSIARKKLIDKSLISENDNEELKFINTFDLDSSQVKIWKYKSRIKSEVYFPKSDTELLISLYYDNNEPYLVRIIEESVKSKEIEEAYKITELYYKKGDIIDEIVMFGVPICMWADDFNEYFGYSKTITTEILSELINKVYTITLK